MTRSILGLNLKFPKLDPDVLHVEVQGGKFQVSKFHLCVVLSCASRLPVLQHGERHLSITQSHSGNSSEDTEK